MEKQKILFIPTRSHLNLVFSQETAQRLESCFNVTFNWEDRNYTSEEVAQKIRGFDGLITGWGSPPLTESIFENADRLKIIAHSAGSVKQLLSEDIVRRHIIPRKICVCNANKAIAFNVAEATVGLLIMASHRFLDHVISIREKRIWRNPDIPWNTKTLNGSTIGVVAASTVGREVIRLLQAFDAKILVYDPYLSEWEVERLNVEKTTLENLFRRSDFVTIHAPVTKETVHMINGRHLEMLRDGAVLVNTSRGVIIDQDALLRECETGRIIAALDVTDPEPLPLDSRFRDLKNVIITPHISGAGRYGYYRIGEMILQALEDYFADKRVEVEINFEKYNILA